MLDLPTAALTSLNTPSLIIDSLDDGRSFHFESELALYPASMIKMPIAFATATALATYVIPDEPILIEERFMTDNDAPSAFVPGYAASAWELIEAMVAFSDNVATNVLIDYVGRARANDICEHAGLQRTAIRRFLSGSLPRIADPDTTGENEHPTKDAVLLFSIIARGTVAYADRLQAILRKQYWNAKLSAGLLPGDVFAHKTGDTSDSSHDGGILTTVEGKRYALALYSSSPSNDATDMQFAAVMRSIRPFL